MGKKSKKERLNEWKRTFYKSIIVIFILEIFFNIDVVAIQLLSLIAISEMLIIVVDDD